MGSLIVASVTLSFISRFESRSVLHQPQQQSPGWIAYFGFLLRVDLANRKILGPVDLFAAFYRISLLFI